MGSYALASSVSDQITRYDGNIDVYDNDDSKSFETPRKNNCSSSCFGDTITNLFINHGCICKFDYLCIFIGIIEQ